jgi:pyruvate kinase
MNETSGGTSEMGYRFMPTPLWFTYGPSLDDKRLLEQALAAGANGCRLTFSYGTHELQGDRAHKIRQIADRLNKPCLIIADLGGEKIRLGDFLPAHIEVKQGDVVSFCPPENNTDIASMRFSTTSHKLFHQVSVGNKIIIGDGSLSVIVNTVNSSHISGTAINDGSVNPNRGVTVVGSGFHPASLTNKDIDDLTYIAASPLFDAVALSFVSTPSDISHAREILQPRKMPIIAKIETEQALSHLESIVEQSDLVMAARGDLALAIDWIELPDAVKRIGLAAATQEKPWMLATQIASGMDQYAFPTRAEICDLAHWLSHGAAGIMLTSETAFGKRPIEAIAAVARMIERWKAK